MAIQVGDMVYIQIGENSSGPWRVDSINGNQATVSRIDGSGTPQSASAAIASLKLQSEVQEENFKRGQDILKLNSDSDDDDDWLFKS